MTRLLNSNTDGVTATDRQAAGNQPDQSTPTGTEQTPLTPGSSPTGPAGGALAGNYPNPSLAAVGTAGNYQRVTTNAAGQVSAGQNDVVNVKQYGATGNGSTDDLAAINSAIAALSSHGTLYFPAGKYKITGQPSGFSGLSNITICGDGWSSEIHSTVTGAAGNTLNIDETCSFVSVRDLAITGSATVRGSGIHIRLYASDSEIRDCYIKGCSDFGIHLSGNAAGTAYGQRQSVIGCLVSSTLGDGIHANAVKDCLIQDNTVIHAGDDSIAAVADNASYPPVRVTICDNEIYDGQVRGIAILEVTDFIVDGNIVTTTVNAPIEVNRFTSTSAYNTRGQVTNNRLYNGNTTLGPIGSINLYFCEEVKCSGNLVDTPSTGAGICFLDIQHCAITDNQVYNAPTYGIRGYTFGAAHVAASWTGNTISRNWVDTTGTGDGIWATPDTGCTLVGFFCCSNELYNLGSGVAITYQNINPGRLYNNTSITGTYVNGGSFTGTAGNNNS